MPDRPLYLAKFRTTPTQRAHFGVFIPNAACADRDPNDRSAPCPCPGTEIHVVGLAMSGYAHEFKRHFDPCTSRDFERAIRIASIDAEHIVEPADAVFSRDRVPLGRLDGLALHVPAPRRNENFLAPVNDTTNRRCQEWTMDYLRLLESKGYVDHRAVVLAQGERDPPSHGIGLRSAGR